MKLPMHKSRSHSIIIIAAIRQERGLVEYQAFIASNKAKRFSTFMNGLMLKF